MEAPPPCDAVAAACVPASLVDAALDVTANVFPRDTVARLRACNRAASRDPQLQLLAAITFPH
jgi:hypothetical protein